MSSDFDRFEQTYQRQTIEDYGDAAAIVASRIEFKTVVPEQAAELLSDEDIIAAINAAKDTLKYRIASKAYNLDNAFGTQSRYSALEQAAFGLLT